MLGCSESGPGTHFQMLWELGNRVPHLPFLFTEDHLPMNWKENAGCYTVHTDVCADELLRKSITEELRETQTVSLCPL